MKRLILTTLLLALAVTLTTLPAAADSPLPTPAQGSCAYAGPTSLDLQNPADAPSDLEAELFRPAYQVHLGYGAWDELVGPSAEAMSSALAFQTNDQECSILGESCGPPYRDGSCCTSPEATRETKRCRVFFECNDIVDFFDIDVYTCVGATCL